MGYTTKFKGRLEFVNELTASQFAALKIILDCDSPGGYEIDLILTADFKALAWNGAEKTYGMPEAVNHIIRKMREKYPDFGLTGQLAAYGEDPDDRWTLFIDENGMAETEEQILVGTKVQCPHCNEIFRIRE